MPNEVIPASADKIGAVTKAMIDAREDEQIKLLICLHERIDELDGVRKVRISSNSPWTNSSLGIMSQDIKTDLRLTDTELGFPSGIAFVLFYAVIPIARWADRGNRVTITALTTASWSVAEGSDFRASQFASPNSPKHLAEMIQQLHAQDFGVTVRPSALTSSANI
jgi:hypothetical protein